MTNLPDVTFNILDGQLGQVPSSVAGAAVTMGICSGGAVGSIYALGSTSGLSALGVGPLVEAVGDKLAVAGGPQYALPLNPRSYGDYYNLGGTLHAVTPTGTGSGSVAVAFAPKTAIAMKVQTAGALGTAKMQFSVNGGAYSDPVATAAGPWTYQIPGTLTKVTVTAGTYVANDVYTITTDGTVSRSGSGPDDTHVTHADSPMDVYDVLVSIVTGGAVGTAVFTYSVDGGNSNSAPIATSAKYAIPGTGIVLAFSSTFTAGDTYEFTTTAAAYDNTDVTNGFTNLFQSAIEFGFVHLVGMGASSSAAASTAAVVDAQMTIAETAYRFIFSFVECPTVEDDATIAASFKDFVSRRVSVCVGDIRHVSPLTGRIERRNCATVITSRTSKVVAGEDIGWVGRGAIPNISPTNGLYRDEAATPMLDAARFTTMRTFTGFPGYYITNGRTMAAGGSDYSYLVNRRVMDVACRIARRAELPFVNGSLRVNDDGSIDERDARAFESIVEHEIVAELMSSSPPQISNCLVTVDRSANILSTSVEPVAIAITPLAYGRQIRNSIGFNNPALAT